MKTKHLLSLIAVCTFTFMTSEGLMAAKWRVNNMPQKYANFTNLQTAINTVAAGDTLIVEGSSSTYGTIAINKSIVLLGPGYFLMENDSTQAFKNSAKLGSIDFQSSASGSILFGFEIINTPLKIQCNDIVISNNYFAINEGNYFIQVFANKTNITIYGNYFVRSYSVNSSFLYIEDNVTSIKIFNNYFYYYAGSNAYLVYMNGTSNAEIYNNIFRSGNLILRNSIFRNNILININSFSITSVLVENNISNLNQIGNQNGNQININMNDVFVCYDDCTGYSPDERFRLKAGSPAINAGYGGVDCGIFDGPFPYSISGLAEMPAIWDIQQNGNQYTIKAKSH